MFRKSLCIMWTVLCPALAFAQTGIFDNCRSVITDGLKEYSVSTESSAYLNTVFDKYCESSGSLKTQSLGLGLDTVVKAIPVKFTGNFSSNEEGMRSFCKEYSSIASGQTDRNRYEEKIVRRAYDSFDQCIVLASTGVVVKHSVRSLEQVDFFIAPGFSHPVTIKGVKTSDGIACEGQDPTSNNSSAKKFGLSSRVVLNGNKSLNLVCTRPGTVDNKGTRVFHEGTVTILTDIRPNGNYAAFFPKEDRLAEDQASVLRQAMDQLKEKNVQLAGSHESLKNSLKHWPAGAPNSVPTIHGGVSGKLGPNHCPDGQYVSGIAVIDQDTGGNCVSCINGVEIICRPIQ